MLQCKRMNSYVGQKGLNWDSSEFGCSVLRRSDSEAWVTLTEYPNVEFYSNFRSNNVFRSFKRFRMYQHLFGTILLSIDVSSSSSHCYFIFMFDRIWQLFRLAHLRRSSLFCQSHVGGTYRFCISAYAVGRKLRSK